MNPSDETNFGFQKVSFKQKQQLVHDIFSSVANKYDIMNDAMSLGIHRLWKSEFVQQIPSLNSNILDMAGGTGDISFKLLERAKKQGKSVNITLCDINEEMLKISKERAINNNFLSGISYVCTDAEALPFPDNSFDYYTIAFGIRNVPKIELALKEAFRVLKPTGKFLCLEFSKLQNNFLNTLYNFYSFNIIPQIGQILTGNKSAYQYLVESIKQFPDQEEFCRLLRQSGFKKVRYQNLSCGITAIHSGYKFS